ncbi:MAG: DUF951 domain-containing protein [Dehalococcoidales bacterium]|nr:DUF951 domain-containing protein [Dehalococcoidales bacterium]
MAILELRLGDILHLKKPHPCGSYDWVVVRLGADIGIKCIQCQHTVLLARPVLERRIKAFVARGKKEG